MLEKISRYILAVCMSVALLNWVLQFSAESMMAKKKLFAAARGIHEGVKGNADILLLVTAAIIDVQGTRLTS